MLSGMAKKKVENAQRGGEKPAQPRIVPATLGADPLPDWIRLPRPRERLGGLSRTTWNELLDCGIIEGVRLRKPAAKRGIRLLYRPSVENYLRGLLSQDTLPRKGQRYDRPA